MPLYTANSYTPSPHTASPYPASPVYNELQRVPYATNSVYNEPHAYKASSYTAVQSGRAVIISKSTTEKNFDRPLCADSPNLPACVGGSESPSSEDGTEIFDARTHKSVGSIGSSEDIVEIDFTDGVITRTSDQYAIGRATR